MFLLAYKLNSQDSITLEYFKMVARAESMYKIKDYHNANINFSSAFLAFGDRGYIIHRYYAACSWAMIGEIDSAFNQLYRIAINGKYGGYTQITNEPDLLSLHSDKRWQHLVELVKYNKEVAESRLNRNLIIVLDSIYSIEKSYLFQTSEISNKYGGESDELKSHLWKIEKTKAYNLAKVRNILDKYNWLSPDIIGRQGFITLFQKIKEADHTIQLLYLPSLRAAAENDKVHNNNLSILEDKVSLTQRKRQIYGTQIWIDDKTNIRYVLPLDDPENVDIRRLNLGLETLAVYLNGLKIRWDVNQHKNDIPMLEKMMDK